MREPFLKIRRRAGSLKGGLARGATRLLLTAFAASLGPAPAAAAQHAQDKKHDRAEEVDPYTGGDPEKLERAGYLSMGPGAWGGGHSALEIEEALGGTRMQWVETLHFRIGSTLDPHQLGDDPVETRRVREEVKRLGERMDVPRRPRELDHWLRLHLFAQRLEELYAEVGELLAVQDPGASMARPVPASAKFVKPYIAPYMGMGNKYLVLMFQSKSDLGRYGQRFFGLTETSPAFDHHFADTGHLLTVFSAEALEEHYKSDLAQQCMLTYQVTVNLASGYRGYRREMPVWWIHGLGHLMSRRIDPRFNPYGSSSGQRTINERAWDWKTIVRDRVLAKRTLPWDTLMAASLDNLTWSERLELWSRIDFMAQQESAIPRFAALLEDPALLGRRTPQDLDVQREALERACGQPLDAIEADWRTYVRRAYAKR